MNLTKNEIQDYNIFLKEHKKSLREFVPVLSPRQLRFANLVIQTLEHYNMSCRGFMKTFHCSEHTVMEICKIIRAKKLPFKYTESLDCRRLERFYDGRYKAHCLQQMFSRSRRKSVADFVTDVTKTATCDIKR
jgi:hypothetical protein